MHTQLIHLSINKCPQSQSEKNNLFYNKHEFQPNSATTSNGHVPKTHLVALKKDKQWFTLHTQIWGWYLLRKRWDNCFVPKKHCFLQFCLMVYILWFGVDFFLSLILTLHKLWDCYLFTYFRDVKKKCFLLIGRWHYCFTLSLTWFRERNTS